MGLECQLPENPKVTVLLSTYNGEKYVREQIESVLEQTYSNIQLLVRDDGSKDGTLRILQEYEKRNQLKLIAGDNVGYISSFFELLVKCDTTDYYAWCDQDDVWEKGKIERAVEVLMNNGENNIPVLYFSDYDYYDSQMVFQKHGLHHQRGPSFANSLMDCIALGFNSVFNDVAREKMLEHIPQHCCGHDWWTYMVCAAFGKVLYDEGYYTVRYRRQPQAVSPGGRGFLDLQIWRFKKFFLNDYFAKIRMQLQEFASLYQEELKTKDRKIMKFFADDKYSLVRAVRKTFYPVWFRQGLSEELMVRVLFLLGRL